MVSGVVPTAAFAVTVRTARKVKSKQNTEGIPLRLKPKSFTIRPLGPR
jgi:hypothetical protein